MLWFSYTSVCLDLSAVSFQSEVCILWGSVPVLCVNNQQHEVTLDHN